MDLVILFFVLCAIAWLRAPVKLDLRAAGPVPGRARRAARPPHAGAGRAALPSG